jgi:hypothetical protein
MCKQLCPSPLPDSACLCQMCQRGAWTKAVPHPLLHTSKTRTSHQYMLLISRTGQKLTCWTYYAYLHMHTSIYIKATNFATNFNRMTDVSRSHIIALASVQVNAHTCSHLLFYVLQRHAYPFQPFALHWMTSAGTRPSRASCRRTPSWRTHVCAYKHRVGQNRIYTPYMTVYLVILLPKIPYIHRIYMVLANPIYARCIHRILSRRKLEYTFGHTRAHVGF